MREYEEIADRIAASKLGPVLDWGCGYGQVTYLLRQRGVEVEAFDYRVGGYVREIELERFPGLTAQISGDPVRLPFGDGHFAAVLSCGVLEHVQYPEASLKELRRVLRPGGRLFVYKLPNRYSYLEAIAKRIGWYYHGKLPYDRVYDRRGAIDLLRRGGFEVDDFRRANMLPLSIPSPLAWRYKNQLWWLNQSLARIPLVNLIATNLEADATAVA
jgi:ubiquinone/menaquinone biosynthesis C-methylase UbiE